jgi:arylsulfatase
LLIDGAVAGAVAGAVHITGAWPINPARQGLACGRDVGSAVSQRYRAPYRFTGRLHDVVVTLGDDQVRDLAAEAREMRVED